MGGAAPVLETERLILRLPEPQDFEGYARFAADPAKMAHLGGSLVRSMAWRDFSLRAGAWLTRGYSMFSVIERASGQWVGRVGPWAPEGWPSPEIGWGVAPDFAGKGYAREAAVAAIDYVVDVLGWTQINHMIAPDNLRSIALAQRLGAAHRGPTQLPAPPVRPGDEVAEPPARLETSGGRFHLITVEGPVQRATEAHSARRASTSSARTDEG